jgi:hypothetical protein
MAAGSSPENRIKIFCSLRLNDLDAFVLQRQLDEIGKARLAPGPPDR